MTAHTIVAIDTIVDLGTTAGIGSSSIVIVGIISINAVSVDIVSVIVVISSIIDINSPQRITSLSLQQLPRNLRRWSSTTLRQPHNSKRAAQASPSRTT